MLEYVLRVVSREKEHPLVEDMLLEVGLDARDIAATSEALHAFAELLKNRKTPERLVAFLKNNAVLANNHLLVNRGK
jgi:hypothetical protein